MICGDGSLCFEFEICDDGYADVCGICNANCIVVGVGVICGDGSLCFEIEICDDGNIDEGDGCSVSCDEEELIIKVFDFMGDY